MKRLEIVEKPPLIGKRWGDGKESYRREVQRVRVITSEEPVVVTRTRLMLATAEHKSGGLGFS
jgi:hypothetical protein